MDAEEEIEDGEYVVENMDPKIRHEHAVKYFESIKWMQQNNIDFSKSMILKELQEKAIKIKISNKIKKNIAKSTYVLLMTNGIFFSTKKCAPYLKKCNLVFVS